MADTVRALLEAAAFAADRHRHQRRKDEEASPYINHPIQVADTLARVGSVEDMEVLQAALLHDTIEDTHTEADELIERFGARVSSMVQEVTDDPDLDKAGRKRRQIEVAASMSLGAKQIRIADKICNVGDVVDAPPHGWSLARRKEYLDWTEEVVAGCRGVNAELEAHYDALLLRGRAALGGSGASV